MVRWMVLGSLLARSCATPTGEVALERDFELAVGQGVHLAGTSLTISFSGVGQDSRCPATVQCVWAGNAEVRLRLVSAGAAADVSVNSGIEPHRTTSGGVVVELVDVIPLPDPGGTPPAPSAYRVRLRASRP